MVITIMQERFAQVSRPCLLERDGGLSLELREALPWMCRRARQEPEWARGGGGGAVIFGAGNKGAGDIISEPAVFEGEVR